RVAVDEPRRPGVVPDPRAPGTRVTPVPGAEVRRIIVAGAVDHGAVGDVAAQVASRVARYHLLRRAVIHLHGGRRVERVARRDVVALVGDLVGDGPRPLRLVADEPDTLEAAVVFAVGRPDDVVGGVGRRTQLGARDLPPLRGAVVRHFQLG